MSNALKLLLIIATLLAVPALQAQQLSGSAPADTLELDRVVVTASKIPQLQRETTKPIQVISRQQIEQSAARNIAQLLNAQSGIRVNDSFGSPANPQILFMQGASATFTLILKDGLPLNDPSGSGGLFDLRLLSPHNVERIEILKGSQSTLYGTDAVAGVINIITRESGQEPFQLESDLSYGSFNTFNGSVSVHGSAAPRAGYTVSYKRASSDGFSSARNPGTADSFEKDGFDSDHLYAKLDLKPADGLTVSPFITYSRFDGDFDAGAFADADQQFELTMVHPGFTARYDRDRFALNAGYNYTRTERAFISSFSSEFDGRFHNADLFGTAQLHRHVKAMAGLNYQQFRIPVQDAPSFQSEITSPYATLLIQDLAGFSTELGYRLNIHTQYGENATYSVAPAYQLLPSVKLTASFTTGFKAPTLDELFGPFGPNPELQPQTSRYIHAGAEVTLLRESLKLSGLYFNREIDDLILFTGVQGFINRDQQDDEGVELRGDWIATNRVRLSAHYNYTTGRLVTTDENGQTVREDNLIRRPAHNLGAAVSASVTDRLMLRAEAEYNGERDDLFFNPANNFAQETVLLDSYTLVHLYGEYTLQGGLVSVYGQVRNLFDTDFTEVYGFNTAGIAVTGGVRIRL
ncbi:MAG: TonB-dependent receptor plug domain-containing protein [Balneolaceae bacterium]